MDPQNQQQPKPNFQTTMPPLAPQNKSSIGGIIGTIIIIAIIILGGLYFWGKRVEENKLKQNLVSQNNETTTQVTTENEATAIKSVSQGDDLQSIQNDLNNTKLDNLDKEVNP